MSGNMKQAGFTLVEMMVVVVITGLVSTALYQMLEVGSASYDRNKTQIDMQQNARVGLQTLTDDLRLVSYGKDPTQPSIHYAGPDSVTFVADIDPSSPGAEQISYFLSSSGDSDTPNPTDTILMRSVADTSGNVLVQGPQTYGVAAAGLSFRWFNGSGVELANPVPQPELIGEMSVDLTTEAAREVDGDFPSVTLSATIYPRNLPLSPARSRPSTPSCSGPVYPNCESATLSWVTPTTNTDGTSLPLSDVSHFNFYFGTDSNDLDLFTRLARTINQWTVADLDASETYYVAVACVSRSGVESYFCQRSVSVSSTLTPNPVASITSSSTGGVSLTWPAVTNFTNGDPITTPVTYNVFRGPDSTVTADPGFQIAEVEWATTYLDTETTGIDCGQYYYLVNAEACSNEGAPSDRVSAELPARPACASDVYATTTGTPGEVFVSWTAPTTRQDGTALDPDDIQFFHVYADTSSGMPTNYYGVVPGNTSSVTLPSLMACTTYYFNVTAVDDCGHEGDLCPGEEISVFTSAPCDADPPSSPPSLSVVSYDDHMALEWPANVDDCDLSGYRIYYGSTAGGPYHGTDSADGYSPIEVLAADVTYGNVCRFDLSGLGSCNDYFIKVTAIDQCSPPNESPGSSGEQSGQTVCTPCAINSNCVAWAVDGSQDNQLHLELYTESASSEILNEFQPSWSGSQMLEEVWFGRPLTKVWAMDGSAGEDGYTGPVGSSTVLNIDDVTVPDWSSISDAEPFALVFDSDVRSTGLDMNFRAGLGTCSADGAGTGAIMADDFDDGSIADWSVQSGNWFGSNGEMNQTFTGSNYIVLASNSNFTTSTMEAKVKASGGSVHSVYLVYRYEDSNNYSLFGIRTDANKVRSARIENGSFIQTGVYYTTLSDNTWYNIRVVVDGNRVKGYFNCDLVVDINEGYMANSGKVGVTTRRTTGTFDDVKLFPAEVYP